VDEREWLGEHLYNTKGRDAMLFEAERIVPLASEEEIEVVFGEGIVGRTGSAQANLLEYMRNLPGAGFVRSSLLELIRVIGPSKITDEYSVEMAQEIGGPQT
jgi:hypothetical protein